MKKGLSVLLIAAALFGFYGGAVNLNDVLACKDYWEEEGEKSTADMNKLEDGLNQLKDNEQAYLDGLDAVAEGEEALAQGEQDYADGQATLAKGEADYAAAPGKLAAARKQIKKGESDLAEGKEQLKGLASLIKGIDQVLNGYNNTWKPGYDKLHEGRKTIVGGLNTKLPVGVTVAQALGAVAESIEDESARGAYTSALGALAGDDDSKQTAEEYKKFMQNCGIVKTAVDTAKEKAQQAVDTISGLKTKVSSATGALDATTEATIKAILGANTSIPTPQGSSVTVSDALAMFSGGDQNIGIGKQLIGGALDTALDTAQGKLNTLSNPALAPLLKGMGDMSENTGKIDELVAGQDTIADGIHQISAGALSSDTLKDAIKEKMGQSAIALLTAYKPATNPLSSKLCPDFSKFIAQMETNPGFTTVLPKAKALLASAKASGEKTLSKGEKKLASGKKQYAKGLADYKAAPGKLAAGRAALAEGLQKLMDGRKELAAGKDKLAEYEDGEQQVRDGLATLMGTEPNGGLESILDRRSGDDDFDNGDKHLDLDEGLDAVDVGRGYQADSGELITKEITNRAIGTAAGLGAAALAVHAAILSFLKKNKGAGVLAILSAAAGGAGIAAGTSAGMEFSSIAGSAVGATPWIAFGILAGVAAVHAIAHFASKEA